MALLCCGPLLDLGHFRTGLMHGVSAEVLTIVTSILSTASVVENKTKTSKVLPAQMAVERVTQCRTQLF